MDDDVYVLPLLVLWSTPSRATQKKSMKTQRRGKNAHSIEANDGFERGNYCAASNLNISSNKFIESYVPSV